jgi:quinoprotein glucose dehydrogenase
MSRRFLRIGPALILVLAALVWLRPALSGQAPGQPSTKAGDWWHYTADMRGNRYSPLDQINSSNFKDLEVAWRFKTDNLGPRPEFKLEGTPIAIKGILYTTGGTRRSVIALDGKTGEVIWTHSLREGRRAAVSPRQLSGRGVSYWTDGKGDERIIYTTTGFQLVELNAKTGAMIQSFGKGGALDLKVGVVKGRAEQIDLETGEIGVHSTPAIVKDTVIIGSAMREGATVSTHNNTKGLVRAFDVRTGKLLWTFNTIPRPGEFGNDTWEKESWAINGNVGVWTQITADEELGLVYLPVETPTSDFYGGHRPGNNLFAESLVCVDAKTGQRKWHYQLVHHPIWNFDNSSAPLIFDINANGKTIKAVSLPSKLGWLYVFDRVTGQPVWPIEERPVPASDIPGEKLSPTQPFPTKPPAYARNYLKVPDDLIDFTPELRAAALERLKRYKYEPSPFAPPIIGNVNGPLYGALVASTATNWPGSAADPETHVAYLQAGNMGVGARSLVAPPKEFSDIGYVSGVAGQEFREVMGPGDCCAADAPQRTAQQSTPAPPPANVPADGGPSAGLNVQGLPMVKPPYGLLTAMSVDKGEIIWQVPHGDTPDNIRNHPLLAGKNIPKTGQPGTSGVGLMVTKTLVVMGDPSVTSPPGRQRGAMLRAYDKNNGNQVGEVWMPAPQSGSPMTYLADGKQYMIVAVAGGVYSGEYIAFRLPGGATRTSSQGR